MDAIYVVLFTVKSEKDPPVLSSPSHNWHIYFPTNQESVSLAALIRRVNKYARCGQWQDYRLLRWDGAVASMVKEQKYAILRNGKGC